jgi:TPR repeat protein
VVRTLLIFVLLAFVVVLIFFKGTEYSPLYIEEALQPDKPTRDMLEGYFAGILKNEMPNYKGFTPNKEAENLFERGLKEVLVWDAAHLQSGTNLLKNAAELGSVRAMDLLGYLHENALTGERYSPERSLEWFLKTADFGSLAGLHYVCKYYAFKKEYKSAAPYCELSARDGVPMSMVIMAEFYIVGLGVKKDAAIGKSLICQASTKGKKSGNILMKYGITCDTIAYDE